MMMISQEASDKSKIPENEMAEGDPVDHVITQPNSKIRYHG